MEEQKPFSQILADLMIKRVPAYANKFFYSLGFLSMTSFLILIITGVVMVFYGPNWWLTSGWGVFFRSVHLWATQAFVLFMILHLTIVFLTSGFKKPRRLTWIFGALMFFTVLAQAEFGYVLRGDFASQWRSLQGADLYNGSGIGAILNTLNYKQIYGIHVAIMPLLILGLLFMHYLLIKTRGIAKPYRKEIEVKEVPANHNLLFLRGGALVVLVLVLAKVFPSPFIKPSSIQDVAQQDPALIAKTLVAEFSKSSDTATYTDNISPYTFDTRSVYVAHPYVQYVKAQNSSDRLAAFYNETASLQDQQVKAAADYFDKDTAKIDATNPNPVISVVSTLVPMAQSGLYESSLMSSNPTGDNTTYVTRFLADTGVMDDKATALGITTEQYGMLRDASDKRFIPGAWWLAPLGLMDHTILAKDDNQDRDGAIILGLFLILMLAFPFIPGLNVIPDKIKAYKLIWR